MALGAAPLPPPAASLAPPPTLTATCLPFASPLVPPVGAIAGAVDAVAEAASGLPVSAAAAPLAAGWTGRVLVGAPTAARGCIVAVTCFFGAGEAVGRAAGTEVAATFMLAGVGRIGVWLGGGSGVWLGGTDVDSARGEVGEGGGVAVRVGAKGVGVRTNVAEGGKVAV